MCDCACTGHVSVCVCVCVWCVVCGVCVQVCEHVVDAMRGGAPLPPSLLTKMIKYKVLRRRAMERAEVARKVIILYTEVITHVCMHPPSLHPSLPQSLSPLLQSSSFSPLQEVIITHDYILCSCGLQEAEMAAQKQAAEKGGEGKGGKGGKAGGGRTSKAGGGKKGKDTPAVDAASAIPLPEKPPTSMRKRGEEDLDSKYIGE